MPDPRDSVVAVVVRAGGVAASGASAGPGDGAVGVGGGGPVAEGLGAVPASGRWMQVVDGGVRPVVVDDVVEVLRRGVGEASGRGAGGEVAVRDEPG